MQANGKDIARRQHIAEAIPNIATLAEFRRRQPQFCQFFIQRRQTRPVMPQHIVILRQARKIFFGMGKLVFIGAVKADGDAAQIRHFGQFIDDIFQRRPL